MFLLVVIVAVVVIGAVMWSRRRTEVVAGRPRSIRSEDIEAAVADSTLTRLQADALYQRSLAQGSARSEGGVPPVAEALGYLGGLLSLVAGAILVSRVWDDLADGAHVAFLALGSVALLVAGLLVGEDRGPAGRRLEAFLWLLSAAALAGTAGVAAVELAGFEGATVAFVVGASCTVHGLALWRFGVRPVQQAVANVAVVVTFGALAGMVASQAAVGFTVMALGGAALALGERRVVRVAEVESALGLLGLLVAGMIVTGQWTAAGLLLGLATTLAIGAVGVARQRLPWNLAALAGLVVYLPSTLGYFFADSAGLPLLLFAAGTALLVLAIVMVRRSGGHERRPPMAPRPV